MASVLNGHLIVSGYTFVIYFNLIRILKSRTYIYIESFPICSSYYLFIGIEALEIVVYAGIVYII